LKAEARQWVNEISRLRFEANPALLLSPTAKAALVNKIERLFGNSTSKNLYELSNEFASMCG
jgi:hypothetical protein